MNIDITINGMNKQDRMNARRLKRNQKLAQKVKERVDAEMKLVEIFLFGDLPDHEKAVKRAEYYAQRINDEIRKVIK